MTNKYRKVWKIISQKVNSGKQTWPTGRVNILAMDGHYPEENVSPNFI
jgi:hypothetical protein